MSDEHDDVPIDGVPSPCVRNCCLDDHDVCLGCFRSISEICGWHAASDQEKMEIIIRCRARYSERFGGAASKQKTT